MILVKWKLLYESIIQNVICFEVRPNFHHSILQNILLWCDLLIILGATNSTDTSFIVQKFLNACCNNKIFGTTVNNVKFVSFAQFPTSHSNYNTEFN